jgi:two-component system, cell cycle sensor histidine kinase and response regulator CckA
VSPEKIEELLQKEIAERKRLEKQLHDTQLRYQALVEHLPVITYIAEFGIEGEWVYVSPQIEKILGYSTSEWIDTIGIWTARLDPRDRDRVLKEEALSHESGDPFHCEYRILAKDGRVVWVHDEAVVITDKEGNPLFLQGIISDICNRKEMEETLRQNEKWFETLSHLSPVGIFRTDSEGNCLYVNEQWSEIAGLSLEEASGKGWMEALHPQDCDRVLQEWTEAITKNKPFTGEYRFRRPDGVTTWVIGQSVSVTRDYGEIIGYIGTVTDISDRKEREETLRESELRLRTFVGSVDEIVFELDGNGTYLNIWTTNENLLVRPKNEVLGHGIDEFFAPEYVKEARERFHRVLETGQPETFEYFLEVPAGKRWFLARVSPVPASDGSFKTVCVSTRDVTDLKYLQEQLLQSQKIETVGRLAGGIAHDFNNLLMAISGYCELIGMKYQLDSSLVQHIKEIEKAAEHGASLTRQLLAFSRKQVLASKALNLNELIQKMQHMISRLIGERIRLEIQLEPELATIMGDSGQIEQVIMNLVVNARDAMPDGGRLRIETANTEFTADSIRQHPGLKPGRYALLSISDSGIGMDELTKSQIFEPFFTTKGVGKGTGLGLATVYGIIRQSGGDIKVISQPGMGSSFLIFLPSVVETIRNSEVAEERSSQNYSGTECILLVDDNHNLRKAIASSLDMHGYSVVQASDGVEALKISRDHAGEIQLLVTDMVMPTITGKELATKMKLERPDIKILYMSGYSDESGFSDEDLADHQYLQKPASVLAVLQKIRKLLDKKNL